MMRRLVVDDAQRGMTMIELLVYMVISSIVLTMIGALIINNTTISRDVFAQTGASGAGQSAANSIRTSIREASWISTPTTGTTQFVTARTALNGSVSGWQCQAWYFDSAGTGALYTRTSPTAIASPTTDLSQWRILASGVTAEAGIPVFSLSSRTLSVDFQVAAPPRSPVLIRTAVTARQPSSASAPC